jgi:polar amino acid transport system ATP-binding protein
VEVVLEAADLVKEFGSLKVLDGASISLRKGEVKMLVGPNGSGKTTLLKCLNLLLRPDSGSIYLEGVEVTAPGVDAKLVRQRVALVFQESYLFSHMTAFENVLFGPYKVKKLARSEAEKLAVNALEEVGLDRGSWTLYPAQLSGGQRQRVAIARALAMGPSVILYDEPTSSLDPVGAEEVVATIVELARNGVTSLVVTHDVGLLAALDAEVYLMSKGRVVVRGRLEELPALAEKAGDPEAARFARALSLRLEKVRKAVVACRWTSC